MICKHCYQEIAKIVDPFGYDGYPNGQKYGYHHVEASKQHTEGRLVESCEDGNYAEPYIYPNNVQLAERAFYSRQETRMLAYASLAIELMVIDELWPVSWEYA
jgi:hypothetical protein